MAAINNMKLLNFLAIVITVQAANIKNNCDGVTFNNIYHDKEVLHTDLDRPYLLAVDYSTNNLYFSYTIGGENVFTSARINLNTKEFNNITDAVNGFGQTVDQGTHEVYIGTDHGIYKYDYGNNKAELFGAKGVNIWILFFKDVLYYSTFPDQFLYTLVNGESTRLYELEDTKVDNFVIDNENVIFFNNDTGLYSHTKGTKNSLKYPSLEPNVGIRALALDINGKVYACLQDGVYAVNKDTVALDKVLDVDSCFGVAFDNDNHLVYADVNNLYRLKPNENSICSP